MAYLARHSSHGIHIVFNGQRHGAINGIDRLAFSPDGRKIAYSARLGDQWRMIINGEEGVASTEAGQPVFSPDGRHLAYYAKTDDKMFHLVVDGLVNPKASPEDYPVTFSGNSQKVGFIEKADDPALTRLVISDLAFQNRWSRECRCAEVLPDGDQASFASIEEKDSRKRVLRVNFDQPDRVEEGPWFDDIPQLMFGARGGRPVYVASRGGKHFLVWDGREESLPEGGDPSGRPTLRPNGQGAGILMNSSSGWYLYEAPARPAAEKTYYADAADLTYSPDGKLHAFAARVGEGYHVIVNGTKGPAYDRVVAPVFSPDGRWLVYRARKAGKRFVVIAKPDGTVMKEHESHEMVYPPVFTPDGQSVAYGVKDAKQLIWKVEPL